MSTAGFVSCVGAYSYRYYCLDKATEADKAYTQHQQRQDSKTVLVQTWNAFEEHRVGDGAAITAVEFNKQTSAAITGFDF